MHTCWYFTSLPEYVVVGNCICQSETFPPPPSSQFSESASRDVHLIKEKSQSAFKGPTRNLLMSSRCLATDALILAPWKIFPGVCSFMHCCTIIKNIKQFPWRKTILNQRHASNKNTQSSCNHGRKGPRLTPLLCVCAECAGKDPCCPGHVGVYEQPFRVRQDWSPSRSLGQTNFSKHSLRWCSLVWASISFSETTSAVGTNVSLKNSVLRSSELLTWLMVYSMYKG